MNKLEAKEFLKVKLSKGYIIHSMLLDLYEDNDEISENIMNLLYHKPKKYETKFTFNCGIDMANKISKVVRETFIDDIIYGQSRIKITKNNIKKLSQKDIFKIKNNGRR